MKLYSFLTEDGMCAAGLTAYESPATNSGTFQDVYCKKNHVKKNKKTSKKKKSVSHFATPDPLH